ncbi:DUF167 domain-containing protein [Patescibacteria group bacterium]|nr:DUF167 domain-containing protein [Patescibacteria group bacterium]
MKIKARVIPKAKQNKVEATPEGYRIRVTVAPEDGKANEAVIKLLAKHLGVAKSKLRVVKGATSRDKLIELT